MEYYVGLDVSLKQTSICVVDQSGSVVREGVVNSDPEAISVYVRSKAPDAVRIGLCQERTHAPQHTASLFDHLVGAQQESFRDFKTERLGGRQIDDEIELGRLLDRDLGRLRPAQNLVDKIGGASIQVQEVRSIGHQPSRFDELSNVEHRRQSRPQCQGVDANSISGYERVVADIKCLRAALERLEGGRNILRAPDF